MTEFITHKPEDKNAWVCICGNTPSDSGFYPVNEDGHEVEPTETTWPSGHYCCPLCGRVIDPETMQVVRRVDQFVPLV